MIMAQNAECDETIMRLIDNVLHRTQSVHYHHKNSRLAPLLQAEAIRGAYGPSEYNRVISHINKILYTDLFLRHDVFLCDMYSFMASYLIRFLALCRNVIFCPHGSEMEILSIPVQGI